MGTPNAATQPLLSKENLNSWLTFLDSMFPEDYLKSGSKAKIKAEYTFTMFLKDKWTVNQFTLVTKKFARTYQYPNWMPANFYEIFNNEFREPEL